MIPSDRLDQILSRFEYLEARLNAGPEASEIADLTREYSDVKPVAEQVRAHRLLERQIDEARAMLADAEMAELAQAELPELEAALAAGQAQLQLALLPKDAADARPAILEIRPGTGGDEASLFAADLETMYRRYAEGRGWRVEMIERQETDLGGIKELTARIEGENVFARLKFESGVHRVQRVPSTESGGRIHTSAATVAVLPEAEEVDIDIPATDIRIDTMRASGAGGQHVIVSAMQEQHQAAVDAERSADRKAQVGSGDRSERIRTYNFPQGRMTDHRINLTLYKLDAVMQGDLDDVIDALTADLQAQLMAEMGT